ncbi:MAG: thioredoxin family protein [Patescibacteria group bacterium]
MQKKFLLIALAVIIVVGGGIALYMADTDDVVNTNGATQNVNASTTTTDRVEADGTVIKPDGTMVKPDGTMIGPDGKEIVETNTNTNSANANSSSSNTNAATANTNSVKNSNTNATAAAAPAALVDYSAAALAAAQAGTGATVLYFHADWCPTCRVLEPDIQKNLSNLPKNLTILKVNYDKETMLKKQHGVTYQHTFVQVDDSGNKLKLWSGSTNALDISAELI